MSNVTHISVADPTRRERAKYVAWRIDNDDRSQNYIAGRIGIPSSSLGERLSGKVAFTAENLEAIARVLKRDPVEFYKEFLSVGPAGFEPTTFSVKARHLTLVPALPAIDVDAA